MIFTRRIGQLTDVDGVITEKVDMMTMMTSAISLILRKSVAVMMTTPFSTIILRWWCTLHVPLCRVDSLGELGEASMTRPHVNRCDTTAAGVLRWV